MRRWQTVHKPRSGDPPERSKELKGLSATTSLHWIWQDSGAIGEMGGGKERDRPCRYRTDDALAVQVDRSRAGKRSQFADEPKRPAFPACSLHLFVRKIRCTQVVDLHVRYVAIPLRLQFLPEIW